MARDNFVFYKSFYEAVSKLPEENRLGCYEAIFKYVFCDEEPEEAGIASAMFAAFRPIIDINNARYEGGKKGGRPRKEETSEKPSENLPETFEKPSDNLEETYPKPYVSVSVSDSDSESVKEKDSCPEPSPKPAEPEAAVELLPLNGGSGWRPTMSMYEEYVRLYPNVNIDEQFREMRAWCLNNPTKRKTKRGITRFVGSWLSREQDKGPPRAPMEKPKVKQNGFNSFSNQHSYDFDNLERTLGWHGAINTG